MPKPKAPEHFPTVQSGEWVQPRRRGYWMKCCDCGLVHRMNFRLVPYGQGKFKIQFQAFREDET